VYITVSITLHPTTLTGCRHSGLSKSYLAETLIIYFGVAVIVAVKVGELTTVGVLVPVLTGVCVYVAVVVYTGLCSWVAVELGEPVSLAVASGVDVLVAVALPVTVSLTVAVKVEVSAGVEVWLAATAVEVADCTWVGVGVAEG
jgi:hypothetical protein